MEKSTYDKIASIWENCKEKKSTNCPRVVPSVYFAMSDNKEVYYVAKDYSTIVFLVHIYDGKPYTYAIPKKYLSVSTEDDMPHYKINKINKLDLVSCSNKQVDEFDLFIVKNIISKIK